MTKEGFGPNNVPEGWDDACAYSKGECDPTKFAPDELETFYPEDIRYMDLRNAFLAGVRWKTKSSVEPKGNEQLLSAIRAIVEQSHDRDSDALAMGEISDLLKAATVKPVGTIEDLPFIPIKPEVLQAFAKQMLDWGIVWVKYSPGGQAEVIPRDQVMQWPATENQPAEGT